MIWCVDDDATIREIEVYTLCSTGFQAEGFADGRSMQEALKREKPELIVLDIMLPGEDGVEILKKLRENPETKRIPVIMATAKGTEMDKIHSLDLGADDYLVKPFGVMEMVSRIKAVLRRCNSKENVKELLYAGDIVLNLKEHIVKVKEERVTLTLKEYEILRLFMENPRQVFSREQLLSDVWGVEYAGETRTVDMHMKTLRQKLGESGKMIKTVIGVGYRLEVE
ncbi:MAG: response regulator transcription factor [Lachnospiraceae bacterium]|nr:response regulator transcription factor [Lachnospiraceae bacterium]